MTSLKDRIMGKSEPKAEAPSKAKPKPPTVKQLTEARGDLEFDLGRTNRTGIDRPLSSRRPSVPYPSRR